MEGRGADGLKKPEERGNREQKRVDAPSGEQTKLVDISPNEKLAIACLDITEAERNWLTAQKVFERNVEMGVREQVARVSGLVGMADKKFSEDCLQAHPEDSNYFLARKNALMAANDFALDRIEAGIPLSYDNKQKIINSEFASLTKDNPSLAAIYNTSSHIIGDLTLFHKNLIVSLGDMPLGNPPKTFDGEYIVKGLGLTPAEQNCLANNTAETREVLKKELAGPRTLSDDELTDMTIDRICGAQFSKKISPTKNSLYTRSDRFDQTFQAFGRRMVDMSTGFYTGYAMEYSRLMQPGQSSPVGVK